MAGVSAAAFQFLAFRFEFAARDRVVFPRHQSGNIVRGAFGTIFRKIVCAPECTGARSCPVRATCPYARIFEPSVSIRPTAGGPWPSGLAEFPRPFVFRAHHVDGRQIDPGEHFHFDAHLFDVREPSLPYFRQAFSQLAGEGIGPGRGRAELIGVEALDLHGAPSAPVRESDQTPPLEIDLEDRAISARSIRIRFATPTELKGGDRPEFPVLAARIRDRVSTMRAIYGHGPLDIDFRGFGERAAQVKMSRCDIQWVEGSRRSTRTRRTHPLGGFTGEAEYEGDLTEFLPYLRAAYWTGAGRQTVWGKGVIETEVTG